MNRKCPRPGLLMTILLLALASYAEAQDRPAEWIEGLPTSDSAGTNNEMDAEYVVTWISARVRSQPTSKAETVEELDFASRVIVLGRSASSPLWLEVITASGGRGFVWAEALTPLDFSFVLRQQEGVFDQISSEPESLVDPQRSLPDEEAAPALSDFSTAETLVGLSDGPVVREGVVLTETGADHFSLELDQSGQLRVELSALSADADLTLLDGAESPIAQSAVGGTSADVLECFLEPGTYYVSVQPYDAEVSYSLSVTLGAPLRTPEEGVIHLGRNFSLLENVSLYFGCENFSDELAISLDTPSVVRFTSSQMSGIVPVEAVLENVEGEALGKVSGEGQWLTDAGEYELQLRAPHSGSFRVQLAADPLEETATELNFQDGREAIDSGALVPGAYALYRLNMDQPAILNVQLESLDPRAFGVSLFESAEFMRIDESVAGSAWQQMRTPVSEGTYFILVSVPAGQGSAGLDYIIRIQHEDD